jgi:hypothetical protein
MSRLHAALVLALGSLAPVIEAQSGASLHCLSLGTPDRPWANGGTRIAISDDGRFAAWIASVDEPTAARPGGFERVLHVVDVETGHVDRHSLAPAVQSWWFDMVAGVSLSADGRVAALNVENHDPDAGLKTRPCVMDVPTGQVRFVELGDADSLGDSGPYAPFLAADGRHLLVRTWNTKRSLRVKQTCLAWHDLQTNETRPLRIEGEQPFNGTCSHDGGIVVMESTQSSGGLLFVWHASDGVVRPLISGGRDLAPDGWMRWPVLSSDGRWVAFLSNAKNLVPGDTNGQTDVFLMELETGKLLRASLSSAGGQADASVREAPSLSADGRFVAFATDAQGLVPDDTDHMTDAFVHDCVSGRTLRVSVDDHGETSGTWECGPPTVSGDGRSVVFATAARLVPEDDHVGIDIYLRRIDWDVPAPAGR